MDPMMSQCCTPTPLVDELRNLIEKKIQLAHSVAVLAKKYDFDVGEANRFLDAEAIKIVNKQVLEEDARKVGWVEAEADHSSAKQEAAAAGVLAVAMLRVEDAESTGAELRGRQPHSPGRARRPSTPLWRSSALVDFPL